MTRLNKEQRKQFSEFLSGFSIAWFSLGVISPLFIKTEDVVKLTRQVLISVALGLFFLWASLRNLKTKRRRKNAS